MIVIVCYLIKTSEKKETANNDNPIEIDEDFDASDITQDIASVSSEEMNEEYMQLFTWKNGTGTQLLETNKVFLFKDYDNDEYRTMIAAASYGNSSAGEYVILEYYETDRGLLGYMVRIRELTDEG